MESRRDFLKKTSLFTGLTTVANVIPASLLKAMSIEAIPGSSYKDAEHIVFLMQENRSFDHTFGTLKGVRGFNDPRVLKTANGNPIWFQASKSGHHFAPFRLDIKNTRATWMGSLPHSWGDMVAARNEGKMDTWLEAKKPGNAAYADMPLTMGYYDRKDIPFYYALADAFTICDQHFCSALTGTSANRTFFWSGSIKEDPEDAQALPHVFNEQIDYKNIGWKTYPERLEAANIPWKAYQNELSIPVGLSNEEEAWLANFGDNSLEYFKQYNVRFHPAHLAFLEKQLSSLPKEISHLEAKNPRSVEEEKQLQDKTQALSDVKEAVKTWNQQEFDALTEFEKNIHKRAFVTNADDPNYHQIERLEYDDQGVKREMIVPKSDVLHQFRKDVAANELPMVSWLTAPSRFSDHPGSPWHGAWYISEVLDILTKNEELWKKTIFVLTYDENDGYFDHSSPFVPPHSDRPNTGKTSAALKTDTEFSGMDPKAGVKEGADSPIGLGFRVPMIIASPWTKGGYVNSQVFDHTSCLQFLEHFIESKTGKLIKETNISPWRRSVCGDLTSVFRPANDQQSVLKPLERNAYIEGIYAARFKPLPGNYTAISAAEITQAKTSNSLNQLRPAQEPGIKPSNALPYDHEVNFKQHTDGTLEMQFKAGNSLFGKKSKAGAFQVYAPGKYKIAKAGKTEELEMNQWNFCVFPGDEIDYKWPVKDFVKDEYELECHGANGFFRSFKDAKTLSGLNVRVAVERLNSKNLTGKMVFSLSASSEKNVILTDRYAKETKNILVKPGKVSQVLIDTNPFNGWYELSIQLKNNSVFEQRYAGRLETGKTSTSDPIMAQNG